MQLLWSGTKEVFLLSEAAEKTINLCKNEAYLHIYYLVMVFFAPWLLFLRQMSLQCVKTYIGRFLFMV